MAGPPAGGSRERAASRRSPIRELDELWLEAVELRIDADLASGRHADLVRELSALARRYPLREHIRRAADARPLPIGPPSGGARGLRRAAPDARGGAGPGAEPGVARAPGGDAAPGPGARPAPARRGAGGAAPPAAARARAAAWPALAAVAAVGLFALLGSEETPEAPRAARTSSSAVSPRSGEVQARVPVGATPSAVAVGEGRVWVLNADDQTISRIDPGTRASRHVRHRSDADGPGGRRGRRVGRQRRAVPRGQSSRAGGDRARAPRSRHAALRARRSACRAAGTAVVSNAVSDHIAVTRRRRLGDRPGRARLGASTRGPNRITATIAGVRARAIAADAEQRLDARRRRRA